VRSGTVIKHEPPLIGFLISFHSSPPKVTVRVEARMDGSGEPERERAGGKDE